MGERTFELLYLGSGAHSEADTAVWLPKERVLFSASVVVNGQFNVIRPWLTIPDILAATKMFKGLNPEFVIPGHGAPGTVKIFDDMERYYAVLVDRVDKMVKEGKSLEQIQQELKMPEYRPLDEQEQNPWEYRNGVPVRGCPIGFQGQLIGPARVEIRYRRDLHAVHARETTMRVRMRVVRTSAMALALVGLLPSMTSAQGQTSGTIAGVVRDTTGGVLPGVTAEASSPALIEKVRVGVTDNDGQYRIVGLSPGEYTVTFTLPGFVTLRRQGIELSVGFTATVNAELTVGGLEESITVSGEAPLVDTRSASRQTAFTRQDMDELPTTQMFSSLAVLIPGVSVASVTGGPRQDVGGSMGERNPTLSYHGSVGTDMPQMVDGVKTNNAGANNGGANSVWSANAGIVEEVIIDTSAFSAETAESGVRANYIMKQGGNRWSGSFSGVYTNDRLQADNLDAAQRAVGLSPYVVKKIWDVNPAIGGPLVQNKLWFFYSYRHWGTDDGAPGTYFEKDPYDFVFEQDLSRPVIKSTWVEAHNLRLTWQFSPNSKFTFYADNLETCNCVRSAASNVAPEAANSRDTPINNFFNATWGWTASNRLLVEVGQAFRRDVWNQYNYAHFTQPDS